MAQKDISVGDLVAFINRLEKQYGLLEWEVFGVKVWLHKRMDLYYKIAKDLGVLENHSPGEERSDLGVILREYEACQTTWGVAKIFARKLRASGVWGKKVDCVLLAHGRILEGLQRESDPYLDATLEELQEQGKSYLLANSHASVQEKLEHIYGDVTFLKFASDLRLGGVKSALAKGFVSRTTFGKIKKRALAKDDGSSKAVIGKFGWSQGVKEEYTLSSVQVGFIRKLEREFFDSFGVELRLQGYLKKAAILFLVESAFYRCLFRVRRPKKVYLTTSYNKMPVTKAAKACGVEVVEIQHGTMSNFHLGYGFPLGGLDLAYFPDVIETWGEYWSRTTSLPPVKVHVRGNRRFRLLRSSYDRVCRRSKKITIISQPVISKRLMSFVLKNKSSLREYELIYKLHPLEESLLDPTLKEELSAWDNLVFEFHGDLYQHLAESEYVIGVFSTAVYEAIGFGCKSILVKLPGVEYMEDLVQEFDIPVVDSEGSLSGVFNDAVSVCADELF